MTTRDAVIDSLYQELATEFKEEQGCTLLFEYQLDNKNFKYEQDYLHPYERFDGSKPISVSMDDWRRCRGNRNRLTNLQLLEGRSNGGKKDMRLIYYYNDMNDEQKGYNQASLAVQKANYAIKMYKKVGFEIVDENEKEYTMICHFC